MNQQQSDSEEDEGRLKANALKHITVMNDEGLTLGLPTSVFYGGVTFTLTFFFMLPFYIGVLFGFVYFMSMYAIHENDPKALQGFLDAALFRRKEIWSGGSYKGRKIFIIDNKD